MYQAFNKRPNGTQKKYRKTFNEKEFSPISAICEHNNISGHQ